MTNIISIPLRQLTERSNYRQTYDDTFVQGIADDMTAHGFNPAYPIQVYQQDNDYVLIDGHTRTRAARIAALHTGQGGDFMVWAVVQDKPSDADFFLIQLSANEQRRDPDVISQALGYQRAIEAGASLSDLCQHTGRSRDYVKTRLDLLKLIDEVQQLVRSGNFPLTYAALMTGLDRNFQLIALRAYNEMKAPNKDDFKAIVDQLITKQNQASLFDLALFTGQPIAAVLDELKVERKKSRQQLEQELADTSALLARIKREATAEILKLRAQLAQKKAS